MRSLQNKACNILLVVVFSAALMELYRAHVELECKCEALAFEANGKADSLRGIACHFSERLRQDAQKIAELEAKLTASTTTKNTTPAPR